MDIDQALERISSHMVTDPSATGGDSSHTIPLTEDSLNSHASRRITSHTPFYHNVWCPTLPPPTDLTDTALTLPPTAPTTGYMTLVTPSPSITLHVKLSKLSIKKFNGNSTKWVTFWDFFNSTIHSNLSLSNVDRID